MAAALSLPRIAAGLLALVVCANAAGAVSEYHSKPIPVEARGGLLEYSVIYTDRATNSMSTTFQVRLLGGAPLVPPACGICSAR